MLADAHPFVDCVIRAESDGIRGAPAPEAFDAVTLRWAISSADYIGVWSAPFPKFANDVARWGIRAADEGAHFITKIETSESSAVQWLTFVERWKRAATVVRVFGEGRPQ
jgi:hypothetical protein